MVEKQQNILKNKLQSNTLRGDFEKKVLREHFFSSCSDEILALFFLTTRTNSFQH